MYQIGGLTWRVACPAAFLTTKLSGTPISEATFISSAASVLSWKCMYAKGQRNRILFCSSADRPTFSSTWEELFHFMSCKSCQKTSYINAQTDGFLCVFFKRFFKIIIINVTNTTVLLTTLIQYNLYIYIFMDITAKHTGYTICTWDWYIVYEFHSLLQGVNVGYLMHVNHPGRGDVMCKVIGCDQVQKVQMTGHY